MGPYKYTRIDDYQAMMIEMPVGLSGEKEGRRVVKSTMTGANKGGVYYLWLLVDEQKDVKAVQHTILREEIYELSIQGITLTAEKIANTDIHGKYLSTFPE